MKKIQRHFCMVDFQLLNKNSTPLKINKCNYTFNN